jgi:CheY-like chemotaxis protein
VSKQSLLLVDGDTRSLRVLEVSLRKAGFTVTPAVSVKDALDKLELHTPDLIISETKFPTDMDGFELRRRLRGAPDWADIPFVFLTTETAIENKIRGLELGVEDYLTKPIYIKEIVTRINILLQKKQRAGFDDRKDGMRFAGRVADMPVVDVIQTIEVSRKSGVIQFVGPTGRQAAIYFRDGRVIDAEAGTLQGEDAVYRLLTWSDGDFEVMFRTVRRREAIKTSSQGLLMEGMRRLDEWSRLLEQLPPLTHRFEIDIAELTVRLGEIPDDNNRILRLVDGKRTLLEVIDASDFGDLECLQTIARLFFEGLLIDLDPDIKPKRDTGKPMPLVVVDEMTPMEEVVSGPIRLAELAARANELPPVAQAVREADVISEDVGPPGPLMGGYRPSSLRLIDEAVAAAQAIEPSLFDPEELAAAAMVPSQIEAGPAPLAKLKLERREDPRIAAARALVEKQIDEAKPVEVEPSKRKNGDAGSGVIELIQDFTAHAHEEAHDSVPTAIDAEEPPMPPPPRGSEDSGELPLRRFAATIKREDSGLRMIGSAGRDRAEASGELRLPKAATEQASGEPAREMVTILPRRRTGEMAAVEPPPAEPAPPAPPPAPPPAAPAVEAPTRPTPPPRISVAGGVVRRRSGPGPGAASLLVLASLLSGATAYMYCHKRLATHHATTAPLDAPQDARVITTSDLPDAEITAFVIDAAPKPDARVAVKAPPDAPAVVEVPPDAAVVVEAPPDAAVARPPRDAAAVVQAPRDAGATDDSKKKAAELYDKGHAALDDGDPARGLELLDESLKLRKTQRTLLERARAEQLLGRVDEAVKSVDDAIAMGDKYAPAYERRALILWSAKRYDEARAAMRTYLELDPQGKSAASFRNLLEPK